MVLKKDSCFLPNSDETEEIKLDNLHVSQGWFDSSVSLNQVMKKEKPLLMDCVAAKVALRLLLCNPTFPLLTIKHKLTLFRKAVECYQLFPIGALTKEVKEEIWLNYST
jgi:dihydroorotase